MYQFASFGVAEKYTLLGFSESNSNVKTASSLVGGATASSASSAHPVEIKIIPTIKVQLKILLVSYVYLFGIKN